MTIHLYLKLITMILDPLQPYGGKRASYHRLSAHQLVLRRSRPTQITEFSITWRKSRELVAISLWLKPCGSKSGMMRQKSLTTIDIRHTEDLVTIALLTKSIVDDPVDDRFIVMSILSGAGYQFAEINGSTQILNKSRTHRRFYAECHLMTGYMFYRVRE